MGGAVLRGWPRPVDNARLLSGHHERKMFAVSEKILTFANMSIKLASAVTETYLGSGGVAPWGETPVTSWVGGPAWPGPGRHARGDNCFRETRKQVTLLGGKASFSPMFLSV